MSLTIYIVPECNPATKRVAGRNFENMKDAAAVAG